MYEKPGLLFLTLSPFNADGGNIYGQQNKTIYTDKKNVDGEFTQVFTKQAKKISPS